MAQARVAALLQSAGCDSSSAALADLMTKLVPLARDKVPTRRGALASVGGY